MNLKFIFVLSLLLTCLPINAQNWFPLEVGNRWDYGITTYSHGGTWSYDSISIIIIDENNFGTAKNYFLFSPYGIFDQKYLRFENDSLYAFIEEDSTECLLLVFNQGDSSRYFASCHYDSVFILFGDENYFGYPDSQQFHGTVYIQYEISKKFGFVFSDDYQLGGLQEIWYHLEGCIISDTTYGVLLDVSIAQNKFPNSFSLSQNFPNPFNPTTNIEFRIADFGFVSLKVYDLLGREVATLVNEEKLAGEYEVEFNAANLPSGIYFYQIRAGRYVETKKMVLLR